MHDGMRPVDLLVVLAVFGVAAAAAGVWETQWVMLGFPIGLAAMAVVRRKVPSSPMDSAEWCECGQRFHATGGGVVRGQVMEFDDTVLVELGIDPESQQSYTCGRCGRVLPTKARRLYEERVRSQVPTDIVDIKGPDPDQWGPEARRARGAE